MQVEVCYLAPGIQDCRTLQLPTGSTLEEAVHASGLLTQQGAIDLKQHKVGIWNKVVSLQTVLREQDRVEIYRPLIADPKEVRKQRAAEGKVMKKGAGDADAPEA